MIKYISKMIILFVALAWLGYVFPVQALASNDQVDPNTASDKVINNSKTNSAGPERIQDSQPESGTDTSESKENSSKQEKVDDSDPIKQEAAQKNGKPKVHPSELDRHWIIKMKKKDLPPAPKQKVDWASKDQKQACEVIGGQMQEVLRNVKYFVVRGDECSTAKYADQFMKVTKQCQEQCPESFFYARGFNPEIVRNVKTLSELGRKLCLDRESRQPDNKMKSDPKK